MWSADREYMFERGEEDKGRLTHAVHGLVLVVPERVGGRGGVARAVDVRHREDGGGAVEVVPERGVEVVPGSGRVCVFFSFRTEEMGKGARGTVDAHGRQAAAVVSRTCTCRMYPVRLVSAGMALSYISCRTGIILTCCIRVGRPRRRLQG